MEVIVTGRRLSISDATKEIVEERTRDAIEQFADRVSRAEIEFTANDVKNPEESIKVEITLRAKGPVVRAEGFSETQREAFEVALDRLRIQLRKAADRRKVHRGLRLADLSAELPPLDIPTEATGEVADDRLSRVIAGIEVAGDGPLSIKEKTFDSPALTLAQALDEMELVGHDFFLYQDVDSGFPSVVYRRRGYNYGVLRMNVV